MYIRRIIFGIFAFLCFLTMQLPAQAVSDLSAFHTNGQTFLTWKAPREEVQYYVLYRSSKPIRTAFSLRQAKRIASIRKGQALNSRLSSILGTQQFFRLPNTSWPLQTDDELTVLTAATNAQWYYAVTAVNKHEEVAQIFPGRNATSTPIFERVKIPVPVYQKRIIFLGKAVDLYVHWVSNTETAGYPAMTSIPSYAFNFAIVKNGKASIHPLLVRFHGRGDHFLNQVLGSGNPQEYVLALDDELPGEIRNSYWFGYHETMDIFSRKITTPTSGKVIDYTTRRARWNIEWVRSTFPIDNSRIYMTGVSMGGSATMFSALAFSDMIAAGLAELPRFDYAPVIDANIPLSDVHSMRMRLIFDKLWGMYAANLMTSTGLRVYDQQRFAYRLRNSSLESLPFLMVFSGKQDDVVGWKQNLDVYGIADKVRSGIQFYWDMRGHQTGNNAPWSVMEDISNLSSYRNNRSYAAVSNCSANSNPGSGMYFEGDSIGVLNAHVEQLEPVIDLPDEWSVGLQLRPLLLRDKLYPSPSKVTIEVTPRRLQRFRVLRNGFYTCTTIDKSGVGNVRVLREKNGELTCTDVSISSDPIRLELRPLAGPLPHH